MLRGGFPEEDVHLLDQIPGTPLALGERAPGKTIVVQTLRGHVAPLGTEAAVRLGLTATVTRMRVRLPAGTVVQVKGRLRFRDRDWTAVQVTPYPSYTRVIVE